MRVDPFEVDDSIPEEAEIEWVVKRIRSKPLQGVLRDAGTSPLALALGGQ